MSELAKQAVPEAASSQTAKSSSWPETSSKSVAYWLLGSAASVFGIVVFGGLTRLTESGYVLKHPSALYADMNKHDSGSIG